MVLLAVDIDGTLVGDNASMKKLLDKLLKLRKANRIKLVYSTGRSLESLHQLMTEIDISTPEAAIVSVGTEIYLGPEYKALEEWQDKISVGWNRQKLLEFCLRSVSLQLQPGPAQTAYRIALISNKNQNQDIEKLRVKLSQAFPNVNILESHDGEYIDITPKLSDKGSAVRFLAARWGVAADDIICAGDSENDLSMLKFNKAIIVGNAFDAVRDKLVASKKAYYAEAKFAAGVAEGLTNYLGSKWGV